MKCGICGSSQAIGQRVTRAYGHGPKLLVIENVPVVLCPRCGEAYLTADTLHELERLKLLRSPLSRRKTVAVAAFP